MKLSTLTRCALLAAICCVATLVIPIPIPGGGYVNAGDIAVLLSAFLLGPAWGAAAAGVGSALTDLILGYTIYAPGTLVIKGACALIAGLILRHRASGWRMPVAFIAGEAVMVAGYFLYELALYQTLAVAAAMIPNSIQALVGIAGALLIAPLVRKLKI